MNPSILFSLASLEWLSCSASAETVVRVLHIVENPKAREIWRAAADRYEKAHPGVKVEFDYLENEAFKAKLPTLLQSSDRPSCFWSRGYGGSRWRLQGFVLQKDS